MSDSHRLRCYEYVNQSYEQVRAKLCADPNAIFRRATMLSAERANAIGAELHVKVGPLDVATEVQIEVGPPEHKMSSAYGFPVTEFPLSWHSKHNPALFPHMHAKLVIFPLSASITQLELEGTYDPPLGLLGEAIDALIGHRIAEASVLQFIQEVGARLRSDVQAVASN